MVNFNAAAVRLIQILTLVSIGLLWTSRSQTAPQPKGRNQSSQFRSTYTNLSRYYQPYVPLAGSVAEVWCQSCHSFSRNEQGVYNREDRNFKRRCFRGQDSKS